MDDIRRRGRPERQAEEPEEGPGYWGMVESVGMPLQFEAHPRRNWGHISEFCRTRWREWWTPRAARGANSPTPLGSVDMRTFPTLVLQAASGGPTFGSYRFYDPGAAAAGYRSGVLQRNPIGAGVVFKNHLPIFPMRQGNYPVGAINWSTTQQGQPGPDFAPLYTPAQLASLLSVEYGMES